jgi:DMSO/TMAO reductase YedYZ molybdopterin-dependent catalytic subunit
VADLFHFAELDQAKRNHGLPLEALRYPITPPGLHYLLSHYDLPAIDPGAWRLSIGGLVERPRALTLAELQALPAIEHVVTMECAGNGRARMPNRPLSQPWFEDGVSTARWLGASLRPLLEEAEIRSDAVEIVFAGPDRGIEAGGEHAYERSLTVAEALEADAILAYEMNGQPLLPQHGAPVRLLVPGWYGMASVKWLVSIEAVAEPFRGHHQAVAYVLRDHPDDEGEPVRRIQPRALIIPPGIPGFPVRTRMLDRGPVVLEGRAWSGEAPVASVEVSTDGGSTWEEAELVRDVDSPWAWCAWRFAWTPAGAGEVELCCRARDAAGNEQPLEPAENLGGYVNNGVQRVRVTVRG